MNSQDETPVNRDAQPPMPARAKDAGPGSPFGPPITTETGAPLTDEMLQPITTS